MIQIEINDSPDCQFKTDREAQKYLQDLSDKIRKHPFYLSTAKIKRLESNKDSWFRSIGKRAKTPKQHLKLAQYTADIAAAKEAQAMIDPPGKIVVNITKIKT